MKLKSKKISNAKDKKLITNSGFSILEVMVASIITSFIAIAVAQVFQLYTESTSTLEARSLTLDITNDIQKILNQTTSTDNQCRFTFQGIAPITLSTNNPNQSITNIRDLSNAVKYQAGTSYGESTQNGSLKPITISRIDLINIRKVANNSDHAQATLRITFVKTGSKRTTMGNTKFIRDLDMEFKLAANNRPNGCSTYGGSMYKTNPGQSVSCAKNGVISFENNSPNCGVIESIVGQEKATMPCNNSEYNGSPYDAEFGPHPWDTNSAYLSFGSSCATLHTAQSAAKAANFVHSEGSINRDSGLALYYMPYTAKSDGTGVIDAIIPFRYLRALPGSTGNGNNHFTNGYHAYLWVKPSGMPDTAYTYAGGGILDNPFKRPQSDHGAQYHRVFRGSSANIGTNEFRSADWHVNHGTSFGGMALVHGSFATRAGVAYTIRVQVGMPENSPGSAATRPPAFFGTLKFADHYAEGSVMVNEILGKF